MTCICALTAFRPSFPHLETLKKILENSTLSRYVKKKKKKKSRPTDPIFKFWSGEGNITIFFFLPKPCTLHLVFRPPGGGGEGYSPNKVYGGVPLKWVTFSQTNP